MLEADFESDAALSLDRADREKNRTSSRLPLGQLEINRTMRPEIHSFRDHHQEKQADADARGMM
jgi:hypothetical protein